MQQREMDEPIWTPTKKTMRNVTAAVILEIG